jgi:hypothetical protein
MFTCLGKNTAIVLVILSCARISYGQCALNTASVNTKEGQTTLNPVTTADKFVTGTVIFSGAATKGTVCVSVGANTEEVQVTDNGSFNAGRYAPFTAGQVISAQFTPSGSGNPGLSDSKTVTQALAANPVSLTISSRFVANTSVLHGHVQPVDSAKLPTASKVYICVWPSQPTAGTSLDCRTGSTKPAPLVVPAGQSDNTYVLAGNDGKFSAQLATALSAGKYVSAVEDSGDSSPPALSGSPVGVTPTGQCNPNFASQPFSDCDVSLSLIGGVEESAQSSSQSATTPFLRVFTRACY